MIKMDYGNAAHRQRLEADFMALLDKDVERQKEWEKLRRKLYRIDVAFKRLLPTKIKKVMVTPYVTLAEIYDTYTSVAIPDKLKLSLENLFNYDKHKKTFSPLSGKIRDFFTDSQYHFKLDTCYYCDMAYINYFKYGRGVRTQFDLDHVLDKSGCPIVALCLYNLVPSCPTCNGPHVKGKRVMKCTLGQRQKLSPTSTLYNFDGMVRLWVKPVPGKIKTQGFLKHREDYDLEFDTSADPDYDEEINFLFLRERYSFHKDEALRLEDLKRKYSPARIKELARIICNVGKNSKVPTTIASYAIIQQIRNDILGSDFMSKHHRALSKLHKDILGY